MKKVTAFFVSALVAVSALSLTACGEQSQQGQTKETEFTPRLDTNTTTTLDIAGFMGNFEALDYVINGFNEIYRNVTIFYDENSTYMLPDYLENNKNVDIFMTADENFQRPGYQGYDVADQCLDLSKDIDLSAVRSEVLSFGQKDGKQVQLPMAMNAFGVVVNKTLLEQEGLSVPKNYEEFLSTLEVLKEKGYTPLQGSDQHLYGELLLNEMMNILHDDPQVLADLMAGKESAADALLPSFQKLDTIVEKGYTDYKLNQTYPADNYDGSIMAFFEGDMPFYVCSAECVSGMKKRESKSEAYTANPFEYEFLYTPDGTTGTYGYSEPWYGFSIYKDSDDIEVAEEFLRYMAQESNLNAMADIKGLPSVTNSGTDERYTAMKAQEIQENFSNDGSVPEVVSTVLKQVAAKYGAGKYKTPEEAAKDCAALLAQ